MVFIKSHDQYTYEIRGALSIKMTKPAVLGVQTVLSTSVISHTHLERVLI